MQRHIVHLLYVELVNRNLKNQVRGGEIPLCHCVCRLFVPTNAHAATPASDDEAAGYMRVHQTWRWESEQPTTQRLNSSLSSSPSFLSSISFMKQISLQRPNSGSHNAVSLLCTDSSSTLISHDTSTYYSISSSSPESKIMQPHYLWLIVKQHLCILMGKVDSPT